MMDPNKIKAWCAAALAVAAVVGGGYKVVDARAQETAEKKAEETVQQHMAPVQESIDQTNDKLTKLVEQGNRQEDRELLIICLENKYQDLSSDERYDKCEEESAARWAEWEAEAEEDDPDG